MGEEQKKPEQGKKPEEEKATGGEKKKPEEGGGEVKDSGEDGKEVKAAPPEIILKVYMHCEGCARKVKKSLRGFNGVEDVITDCKNHRVVVKGEKADPLKVVERIQRKSHRHVELLSPVPKPPSKEEEVQKPEEKKPSKEEKKEKEEPKVVTVVLKVHMHCEACAKEIKRRIEKMKEVEVATPDLKNSEVTVKGTFDPPKLVDYVYRRTSKHAVIVKQEPGAEAKEEGDKGKEAKEEKKVENVEEKKGENGKESKGEDGGGETEVVKNEGGDARGGEAKKKEAGDGKPEKKTEGGNGGGEAEGRGEVAEEDRKMVELRRSEFYYYPPRYAMEMYHAYPPQIFSDENPNACSIM